MAVHPKLRNSIGDGHVVLASASPRRLEIVQDQLGLSNLRTVPSGFPEDLPKDQFAPFEYVVQTALRKALDVYRSEVDADESPDLVLAADTVVVVNGQILEKPRDVGHHVSMLQSLRDSAYPHKVFTGVVAIVPSVGLVAPGYAMETYLGESEVVFRKDITDDEIYKYVESKEGADAAGGYMIQKEGGKFVSNVKGDRFNVIGLPVDGTVELINKTWRIANADSDSESDSDASAE